MSELIPDVVFTPFPKIPRLFRGIVITEKIDGTNASVHISEDGLTIKAASRQQFITPQKDNFGFAMWVEKNKEELLKLGPGSHYGEWWGVGIQRGYDLSERQFSLFNTHKWNDPVLRPQCCSVVPTLSSIDELNTLLIKDILEELEFKGSIAAPGYMKPEGIVVYHKAGNHMYKATLEGDKKNV